MRFLLLLGLLLLSSARRLPAASATSDFACPDNFPCNCTAIGDYRHLVHCATNGSDDGPAFDLNVYQGTKSVGIRCLNSPDWSHFLLGASLRMGNVTTLNLHECKLPGPSFTDSVVGRLGIHGVQLLEVVKLQGNVSREDLDVFTVLKVLILDDSHLGSVPANLLYGLPDLIQLNLYNTQIELPATGFFRRSQSLISLKLGQNDMHDLKPGVFAGLDGLEDLYLSSSNISTLQPGIFHDLPSLQFVYISFNSFTELPADLFSRNRRLNNVYLSNNRVNLTRLPDGFFSGFADLQVVYLEGIGLHSLPENLLWESGTVYKLNLNGNYLSTLPVHLLRDARMLEELSLSSNDLQALPDGMFKNQEKLDTLDLSMNHLRTINENLFVGLGALRELNVAQNDLMFIEPNALFPLRNLRIANFTYNQLDLIDKSLGRLSPFRKCELLKELNLSHNNVTGIFADWTAQLSRLQYLDLSYNFIESLQTEDYQFASERVWINLTHNKISSVDLPRLEFISAVQKTRRHVIIDLNLNPINCDCNVYSLLRYTNKELRAAVLNFIYLELQDLTCHGPDHMRGKHLLDIKASEFKCELEDHDWSNSSDPCTPNGVCKCRFRPRDRTLIVDCASRGLIMAPETIKVYNAERVEVDLSNNYLTFPPSLMGNGYERVRSLNLSNREHDIAEFGGKGEVSVLLLDGNSLRCIEAEILHKIVNVSSISQLTLRRNRWECDCADGTFMNLVQTDRRIVPDRDEVSCTRTYHHRHRVMIETGDPQADLRPPPVDSSIYVYLLVALMFLAAVVALFVCCRIWLRSRNKGSGLLEQENRNSFGTIALQ